LIIFKFVGLFMSIILVVSLSGTSVLKLTAVMIDTLKKGLQRNVVPMRAITS